jgi:hypothetical protein
LSQPGNDWKSIPDDCRTMTRYAEIASVYRRYVPRSARPPSEERMAAWENALHLGARTQEERRREWDAALGLGGELFGKGRLELDLSVGHSLRLDLDKNEVEFCIRKAGGKRYFKCGHAMLKGKDQITSFYPYSKRQAVARIGKPLFGVLAGGLLAEGAGGVYIGCDISQKEGPPEEISGGFYSWVGGMIPGPVDMGIFDVAEFRRVYRILDSLNVDCDDKKSRVSLRNLGIPVAKRLTELARQASFPFSFDSPHMTAAGPAMGFRLPLDGVEIPEKKYR